tara:strand:+ start:205 stop:474 length:270 start_codon:yes stop_codon:yes gene_type:complete
MIVHGDGRVRINSKLTIHIGELIIVKDWDVDEPDSIGIVTDVRFQQWAKQIMVTINWNEVRREGGMVRTQYTLSEYEALKTPLPRAFRG